MAFTVNNTTKQLADTAANLTAPQQPRTWWQIVTGRNQGLDRNVVLAQWTVEEPEGTTKGPALWPGYNPAGIRPGNPYVDKHFATGTNASGFDIFPDSVMGAEAYAYLIAHDPNYAGVRTAIKTGDPQKELSAIAKSGWDSGHYGGNGKNLVAAYNEVTGAKYNFSHVYDSTSTQANPNTALATAFSQFNESSTGGSSGSSNAPAPKKPITLTEVVVIIAGVVLIILLSYRIVTH